MYIIYNIHMYKKMPFLLVFLLSYIILRNIMSYFIVQIDGYRDMPYHINTQFSNTGVGISSTVYDINLASKYIPPYCINNPNLCNT
jgi:hypothetical protein